MMEQFVELAKAYEGSVKQDTQTGRVNLGTLVWAGRNRTWLRVHKKEDAFLIMCHNVPFLEVHHNHFIIIAPPPESTHYTNQMNNILGAVMPKQARHRKHFYIIRRFNDRMAMRICSFGKFRKESCFVDHCIVNSSGEMIYSDFSKAIVEIDKEKVLAMKRQLRNYFKPYEVLVRMQSAETEIKLLSARPHHENIIDLYRRLGLPTLERESESWTKHWDNLNAYIASGKTLDIGLTTLIVLCRLPWSGTRYKDYKQFLEKIKKVKADLRLRFSQICTKVMYDKYIPEEAYAKYQSMVIQSLDGLRSLQVPSQAQVSGQDTGALAPAA